MPIHSAPHGLGWHRDSLDPRDFTPQSRESLEILDATPSRVKTLPARVDWREYFPVAEDQGPLGASPAFACAGLLQYFERRSSGRLIEPSKMFVYKAARRLLGWTGDSGAQLRASWKAIVRLGVPGEESWPYTDANLDREPDSFIYASTQSFASLRYVRLDSPGESGDANLELIKSYLAGGFACVVGFPVANSVNGAAEIAVPSVFDRIRGGQAVIVAGYDDERRFRSYRGALLIRNSWGVEWGEQGYGWLPYAFVREQLIADAWTLMSADWLASGEFRRP